GTTNQPAWARGRTPPAAVAQRRGRGRCSRGASAGHTVRPGTGGGPLLRPGQPTGQRQLRGKPPFRFAHAWDPMNPPLTPPRRGTGANARSPPGRGRGGSVHGEPRRFFSAHWGHEPDLHESLNDE